MTYFWVLGYSDEGKRALLGPYTNEMRAMEIADYLTDSEIYPLETRNQQKATKIVKARLIAEGIEIDDALQRQSHRRQLPTPQPVAAGDRMFEGDPFQD